MKKIVLFLGLVDIRCCGLQSSSVLWNQPVCYQLVISGL